MSHNLTKKKQELLEQFKPGDRVCHEYFGHGNVVRTIPNYLQVEIKFDDGGSVKKVSPARVTMCSCKQETTPAIAVERPTAEIIQFPANRIVRRIVYGPNHAPSARFVTRKPAALIACLS
jgi:hypothetical protein